MYVLIIYTIKWKWHYLAIKVSSSIGTVHLLSPIMFTFLFQTTITLVLSGSVISPAQDVKGNRCPCLTSAVNLRKQTVC